jgi:hypothetical protein
MKKIIFTRSDGGISVVHPVRNTLGETLTTDAEIEQRAWGKVPDNAINPQFVEETAIPSDRTFRNAWVVEAGNVIVDIGKAKSLTKDRLRAERKPLLEAQDVMLQRALETGASTAAIVSEKQRLRDITKQVDALTSLDELKALSL